MHTVLRFSSQFRAAGAKAEYQLDVDREQVTLADLLAAVEKRNPEIASLLVRHVAESGRPFLLFQVEGRTVSLDTELTGDPVVDVFLPICGG